jgi:hypothetical protein
VSTPFSATVIPCPAGFSGLFPTDAADATAPAISALSSDGLQTASTSSFLQPAQQDLASGRKRPLESGNDTSRASTNKARRLINLPDGNQLGIYRTLKACFGEWTDHDALPRPIQKLLHADRVNINSLNKSGHTVLYKELLRGLGQQGLSPEARKHQVRRIEALLENGAHLSDEDLSTYVVDFSAYRSVMSRRDAAFAELIMRIRGDGERTAYPFNFERNLVVHLLSAEPLDEILFKEVRAIVEGGCDLNRPTGNVFASAGDTYPIHELAAEKRPEAIRFLLQHGASLYVRDGRGRPPLFWASDRETIITAKMYSLMRSSADTSWMSFWNFSVW